MKVAARATLVLVALGSAARPVAAHDLRATSLALDVGAGAVEAELRIPAEPLAAARGAPLYGGPGQPLPPADVAAVRAYVRAHLSAYSLDGSPAPFSVEPGAISLERDGDGDSVTAHATLRPAAATPLTSFAVTSDVVTHAQTAHRILVLLRRDFRDGRLDGDPALVGVLARDAPTVDVRRAQASAGRGFRAAFLLGMRHIAEGTDHLLFLLMLLLPAPLLAARRWTAAPDGAWTRGLRATARVVTAFTVGHSATLVAGAVGSLRLNAPLVETLIAASILITALHALRPLFAGWEAAVAAAFGLVHGLAFSTVLAGLGFDRGALALALLGFNLGIEAVQLAVLAAALPLLALAARSPLYAVLRVAGALFGVAAAAGWIAERAFGLPNPIAPAVEVAARAARWLAPALAMAAITYMVSERLLTRGAKKNARDLTHL